MATPRQPDSTDAIRPVLQEVEAELGRHLREACEADARDVSQETSEELLRLEDELLAAVRAVHQTVAIRRVLEQRACDDDTAGRAPSPAVDGTRPPCLVREFTDESGRTWRVWQVTPGAGRERKDSRPRFLEGLAGGWLAFESLADGARRRLIEKPEGWAEMSDAELTALLARSTLVPRRPVISKDGGDSASDAEPTTGSTANP